MTSTERYGLHYKSGFHHKELLPLGIVYTKRNAFDLKERLPLKVMASTKSNSFH